MHTCVPRGVSSHCNFLFGGFNAELCLRSGTSTVKGSSTTWVSQEKNQNIPASLVQMFYLLIYLNFPPTPWNMPWTKVSYLGVQIHFFCWYSPNMTIPSLFSVLPCLVTLPSTFFVLFKSGKVFKQKSSISTSGWASLRCLPGNCYQESCFCYRRGETSCCSFQDIKSSSFCPLKASKFSVLTPVFVLKHLSLPCSSFWIQPPCLSVQHQD